MIAQTAQHGYIMPCQNAIVNHAQQGYTPTGQGFMPSPNGNFVGFQPQQNGFMSPNTSCMQGFSPSGPQFMGSPNFMPNTPQYPAAPNGQQYQEYQNPANTPCTPQFMASPNGFMPSPAGPGFMPSPNGNNFALPNNTQTLPEQCFTGMPTFAPAGFQQSDVSPTGEVSEKVLNWLSRKALEKLEEVIAEDDEETTDFGSETDEAENVYAPLLEDLKPASVAAAAEAILRVHHAAGTEDLAAALAARAVSEPTVTPLACANLLVVLMERLPLGHRREAVAGPTELLSCVVSACHEYLEDVNTESVHESAHGAVLFLGELYKRKFVGMGEVKELFGRLVFNNGETKPHDHCANLACHLFLTVGPFLETCSTGRKLSDCMCARLRELKGINFSEATLFSLAHVTDLKLNKWVPKKESKPKKKDDKKKDDKPAARSQTPAVDSQDEKVLLIGRLFTEQRVAMAVVKELFGQLVFQERVKDSRVELACKLLSTVGSTLDSSETGKKLVEYVMLRLQEVSDAPAVRDVAALRANGWTPLRAFTFRAAHGQAEVRTPVMAC